MNDIEEIIIIRFRNGLKGMREFELYNKAKDQFRTVFAKTFEEACAQLNWPLNDTRCVRGRHSKRMR